MNPALLFLAIVALITALVVWMVLRPLLRKRTVTADAADATTANSESNVEALRIELAEARRDKTLGLLSEASLVEAERELETRVLAESQQAANPTAPRYKRTAISLGVMLPVLAVGGYAAVGSPGAVVPELVRPAPVAQSVADQQMDELFKLAEERLNKEPNDVKGWLLLARAKASVGMFDGAIKAYEKAATLDPKDSEMWADYADSAAGMAQGKMDGKPMELINKALALDGKNIKALLLRGTWEIQKNDLSAAQQSFTAAKALSDAGSGYLQIADNALAEIQSRRSSATPGVASPATAATPPTNSAAPGAPPPAAATSAATLATVTIQLAPAARTAATTNAAVFLIVRAAGADRGPPLAARKLTLADLARPVTLTAADAMIGGAGLKAGAEAIVQARLSLSGQPMAQSGDWESAKTNATLPSPALNLMIDRPIAK